MSIYDGLVKKHSFFDDSDTEINFIKKIKYFYYRHVPYKYRIHELLYRLKCRFWKKYTTYKPRYLDHTWHDRDNILLHICFEILCQFIEKECSPGNIDWNYDKEHRDIMKEMLSLYNWWIDCHTGRPNDYYGLLDKQFDELFQIYDYWIKYNGGPIKHIPLKNKDNKVYAYEIVGEYKDEERHQEYVLARQKLEEMHEEFINSQLKRLIDLRKWMWT